MQCGMVAGQHKSGKPLSENSGFRERTFAQHETRAHARLKEKLAKVDQRPAADYWDFSSLAGLAGVAFLCVRAAFGLP